LRAGAIQGTDVRGFARAFKVILFCFRPPNARGLPCPELTASAIVSDLG
jgi:hypothetical protein